MEKEWFLMEEENFLGFNFIGLFISLDSCLEFIICEFKYNLGIIFSKGLILVFCIWDF